MKVEDAVDVFRQGLKDNPDMSPAVCAVQTLSEFIRTSDAATVSELHSGLKQVIDQLTEADVAVASVESGCELFLRFITLTVLDTPDFVECKEKLLERGKMFVQKASLSRQKIAKLGLPFLRDGAGILLHSSSRVVLRLLSEAAATRRFTVYITESQPDASGYHMLERLKEKGIPASVILDAAVGYVMDKVDLVIVGAEGVVENGGIINKIGTYPIAVMAKAVNKPFYCVAESFKFVRLYPLSQDDVPKSGKLNTSSHVQCLLDHTCSHSHWKGEVHPLVDYTPPSYITLLFTDLGVLTPSAVSDELIKLYL